MNSSKEPVRLKKELGLLRVYAIATGATLSSGFFLLPGLAFKEAGPAMVLSYILAVVPLIPAMFSMVELATAMPRAGGAYFFLDRSMGPLVGTIGGVGTWLALMLKTAFALIGMGAYIRIYFPEMPIVPAAAVLAILFGGANLLGAKKTGSVQIFLVFGLLAILCWFIGSGVTRAEPAHFSDFFSVGFNSILGTAGLVYISYVGVTKVASVAEEVKDPERNLPLGVFLSVLTSLVVYGLGTYVMVGVVAPEKLSGDLTPVASCAEILAGSWGVGLVTISALFAFSAVANAGILSASRYPLAMSRDHLIPGFFKKFNKRGTPSAGIYATLAVILVVIFAFDPMKIAKLASAFQLLLFAMICMAVIVMRESGLESYDSGYRSPFYPWMQLLGIVIPGAIIMEMGPLPVMFSFGLVAVGGAWYFYYARTRVIRHGAIFHLFERFGHQRSEGLDRELRGFLKDRGLREDDPYDEVIASASLIDLNESISFEELTDRASELLAERLPTSAKEIAEGFLQGTRVGATPVSSGAALPHLRLNIQSKPLLVIVRSGPGLHIQVPSLDYSETYDELVYAIFFLVSPEDEAAKHLRILAELAKHIDRDDFMSDWHAAADGLELKESLLREERMLRLELSRSSKAETLIGYALRDLRLPAGSLIALVGKGNENIIPDGSTVLEEGDHLCIIGNSKSIQELQERYVGPKDPAEVD
ncbi:MAG: amino acid permease [Planctomycetota bacterium]|jgi:amino acid transporter/mannitol/fructose-specific phosphotransferase system IIA component (Ntr-type)|nr:amino acid permease [Planctomycetota bacterium]